MSRPGFLVIGAQRSGTTWLDRQLRSHPEIYLPKRRKEVHYFDRYHDRGPDWYAGFFPDAGIRRAVGEITPDYLSHPGVAERIGKELPDVRLIAILRHPVDRAYSQYALEVRDEGETREFPEFLAKRPDVLARGLYASHLARFAAWCPPERLQVHIFEQVMADPRAALSRVADFLGVSEGPFGTIDTGGPVNGAYRPKFQKLYHAAHRVGDVLHDLDLSWVVNLAKEARVPALFGNAGRLPSLDPALRAEWAEFFRADITDLEAFLGRPIPEWHAPAAGSAAAKAPQGAQKDGKKPSVRQAIGR